MLHIQWNPDNDRASLPQTPPAGLTIGWIDLDDLDLAKQGKMPSIDMRRGHLRLEPGDNTVDEGDWDSAVAYAATQPYNRLQQLLEWGAIVVGAN